MPGGPVEVDREEWEPDHGIVPSGGAQGYRNIAGSLLVWLDKMSGNLVTHQYSV
jgi:hypothetical protein